MRRGRTLIFVLLIVVIGLVVAFVALRQLLTPSSQPVTPANEEVYVAGQNIPQGAKITEDVLTTKTLPQNLVTADMYTTDQKSDLLNNKIASIPLSQGTFITKGVCYSMHPKRWRSLALHGQRSSRLEWWRLLFRQRVFLWRLTALQMALMLM